MVIWDIETAQSFKVLFDSWNCRANVSFDTVFPLCSDSHHDSCYLTGMAQGHHLQAGYSTWKEAWFPKHTYYLLDLSFLGRSSSVSSECSKVGTDSNIDYNV